MMCNGSPKSYKLVSIYYTSLHIQLVVQRKVVLLNFKGIFNNELE